MKILVLEPTGLHTAFLGCYGNDWVATPNLDRFAADGIVFDQHFVERPDHSPDLGLLERSAGTGRYFWPGETRYKGVDIEEVARQGRAAEAWVVAFPTPMRSLDDLLAREPRLALFDAVRSGNVWNHDLQDVDRQRPYADFRMRPDLVLADLVKIIHPDLLPDHEFAFYRRWPSATPAKNSN